MLLLVLLGSGFALLMTAALARFLANYSDAAKYIKMEINRAYNPSTYLHWKRELSALRWSIIPGLTPSRVKAIRRFFCRGKHTDRKPHADGFASLFMPSILGICTCAICLAGSTFAWFSASHDADMPRIQAAKYTISIRINDTQYSSGEAIELDKGTYTVTLTAKGGATTGYCVVKTGNTQKTTQQFPSKSYPSNSIAFTLVMHEAGNVLFIPCWGTSTADNTGRIQDGDHHVYGEATVIGENAAITDDGDQPADPPQDDPAAQTTAPSTEVPIPPQQVAESSESTSGHATAETDSPEATDPPPVTNPADSISQGSASEPTTTPV